MVLRYHWAPSHQREYPKTKTQWVSHLEYSGDSQSFSSLDQFKEKHPLDQVFASPYLIIHNYEARVFCSRDIKQTLSIIQWTEMPVFSREWWNPASPQSHACLLQGPPAMGKDFPKSVGWQKRLPVVGSSLLVNRRATPVVLTAADSPEPCLTAPQTHLNSLLTSANTTNRPFVSPLTHRCVSTTVHFKPLSVSNPLRTTHEERYLLQDGAHTVVAFTRFYFSQSFTLRIWSWTAPRRPPGTAANAFPSTAAGRSHGLCPLLPRPPPRWTSPPAHAPLTPGVMQRLRSLRKSVLKTTGRREHARSSR